MKNNYQCNIYDVIIIGMGASGLFAMANISPHINALGIEKNNIAGKKLRITGGGRCNLTRKGSIKEFPNMFTYPSFVRPILNGFNNKQVMDYFISGGLMLSSEGGKVFPKSKNANDVAEFLLTKIKNIGHSIIFGEEVIDVQFTNDVDRLCVKTINNRYFCKKIVIASGGASFSYTGSDGRLISKIFDIKPFSSGLCPLYIEKNVFSDLHGVSVTVQLKYRKHIVSGGLLFAKGYITGPAVLDISNWVEANDEFRVDFLPNISAEELRQRLTYAIKKSPKKLVKNIVLQDICSDNESISTVRLPESVVKAAFQGIGLSDCIAAELKKADLYSVIHVLKEYKMKIKYKFILDKAMATKGGVKIEDINNKNMSYKADDRVHIIGEAIEVIGISGGYNLQFAFSSAMRAVKDINNLT